MSSASVIQLRQLLAEKFPGLRQQLSPQSPAHSPQLNSGNCGLWTVELLSKGAITEIVSGPKTSGSATLIQTLLRRTVAENKIVALVDGNDSLEVTQIAQDVLSRLLWVRCRSAEESLKAADLILRDANLPFVILDLKLNAEKELRKIPATTWYRFQRLVEETNAVCLAFTPRPMIAPARARITLRSQFSLTALENNPDVLLGELKMEISDPRQFAESAALQNTA